MHEPVLLSESMDWLNVRPGGVYVDATVGSGGHARAILRQAAPGGRVLGIDRDAAALGRARAVVETLDLAGEKLVFEGVHGNYSAMAELASEHGIAAVDGVLLDAGLSSEQLAAAERGFALMKDGPLDMRMDLSEKTPTAEMLVNTLSQEDLAQVLRNYGEERRARAIARAIVRERTRAPITRVAHLVKLVGRAAGAKRERIHPATRVFQALRIAVNRELEHLRAGMEAGIRLLKPGGRIVAISFHSLEDRIVKHAFRNHEGRWCALHEGGAAWQGTEPRVRMLTRKPVVPGQEEAGRNPRARSAKLRAAERLRTGQAI